MKNRSYLTVRRYPYEEPHHTQIEVIASNGDFTARTDFYCNVSELAAIGRALQKFPRTIGDEYKFEVGSSDPAARTYHHFVLRAYTIGSAGHCGLQISINQKQPEPDEGISCFSMKVEPASISRLGNLFLSFAELRHLEFRWIPNTDIAELHELHQS